MLVAQQVVQAREEAFDLVFALRHLGGLLALQDVGARGGRHAQGLDEEAGQLAHAEEHGQLVRPGAQRFSTSTGLARRAQRQAAGGAIAGAAHVLVRTARAGAAAETEHLEHDLLVTPSQVILAAGRPS
jgi:hypothetical protein